MEEFYIWIVIDNIGPVCAGDKRGALLAALAGAGPDRVLFPGLCACAALVRSSFIWSGLGRSALSWISEEAEFVGSVDRLRMLMGQAALLSGKKFSCHISGPPAVDINAADAVWGIIALLSENLNRLCFYVARKIRDESSAIFTD